MRNKNKPLSESQKELFLAIPGKSSFSFVEAFKSLRTNIKFISSTSDMNTFVVTSSLPDEYKTTVVVNTAISLAEEGANVVVVDCDFRKPSIHKYLKLGHRFKGVTNVLMGEVSLDDTLVRFEDLGINVMVAGTIPPNPAELLASDKMKNLVETLSQSFDYVIIDTPPVVTVTDAAVLGQYADGVLLVVKSEGPVKDAVVAAKTKLESVGCNIIGTVLTGVDYKKASKKQYYSYGYEYDYEYKDKQLEE